MKWSAIFACVGAAGLAVVLLVLWGLRLGQNAPAPALPPRPPVANSAPNPAPAVEPSPAPTAPVVRNAPRPVPVAIIPLLAPSVLLGQPAVQTGTLRTVDASGALTYLPVDLDAGMPAVAKGALAGKETQIMLDGTPAQLSDLKPGMDIAFLDSGDKPLEKLEAFGLLPDGKPHTKQGPIDKVIAGEITLLAGRRDLFPVALNVAADTPTTIDGQPAKPADLRYRMLAAVKYQGMDAQAIAASTVILDGAAHHADGTLVGADADGVTIHVYGNAGFDVKLKREPAFKMQKETGSAQAPTLVDASLADLKSGQHVVATYTNGSASDITIKLAAAARPRTPASTPAKPPASLP